MPDIRGGLAAASRYILGVLLTCFLIFGGASVLWSTSNIQNTVPLALLNAASWILVFYMLIYPESRLVTGLSRKLEHLGCVPASFLGSILILFGWRQIVCNGNSTGTICMALGCTIYAPLPRLVSFEFAWAQAINDYVAALRNGDPLPDLLQPDVAGGEAGTEPHGESHDSSDTDTSSDTDIAGEADDSGESAEPKYLLSPNSMLTLSNL